MRPWVERAAPALAAVGTALFLVVAAPSVNLTTDAFFNMAWGAELARWETPDLDAPMTPVQHPLPVALGALFSPLGGEGSIDAYRTFALLSLAGLAYAAFRLGRRLAGVFAGTLAVALVLTRPEIVTFAMASTIDIPVTALVLLAGVVVLEDPFRNRYRALALLAVAGLLRPEPWVLSALYGAWLLRRERGDRPWPVAALAVSAPVLWVAMDLALTGDPLGTFHEARTDLGEEFAAAGYMGGGGEPGVVLGGRELFPVLDGLPDLLGWPALLATLIASAAAFWPWRDLPGGTAGIRGARLMAATALLYLLVVVILALGLPYSNRFLVLPAVLLATVAASVGLSRGIPVAARLPVGVALIAVAIGLPGDVSDISQDLDARRAGQETMEQLQSLVAEPEVGSVLSECGQPGASGPIIALAGSAVLALVQDLDPAEIEVRPAPRPEWGSVLRYEVPGTSGEAGRASEPVVSEGPWSFSARC